GHDAKSLLFSLLDEFLFLFHSEGLLADGFFIPRHDVPKQTVTAGSCREGETFDLAKHPQGTEVKAITYSNMQVGTT
ncbi:unnamed protein product, partial [Hapterophycus canaliculatus]